MIDSAVPMTRTLSSKVSSGIYESGVTKLNSDYPIDSNEHHLNNTFELNQ